jgi:hypothetical protein
MKKFSSRLVQSLLPLGIIVLLVSSTVKPMQTVEVIMDESNEYVALEKLSLAGNFKDFQINVSTDKKYAEAIQRLADEGHIAALWSKLGAWYQAGLTASTIDAFYVDLMKFDIMLGINCVQYYNFTGDKTQAKSVYSTIKQHVLDMFKAKITNEVCKGITQSYYEVLTQTTEWINSLYDNCLPSCGWVHGAKAYWHSQWSPSCKFYALGTHQEIEFCSQAACELAKFYFKEFSHNIIETLKQKKSWAEFEKSTNDIELSLNVAALTIGKSVEALHVIETLNEQIAERDQQIKNWEEQASEKDQQIEINTRTLSKRDEQLKEFNGSINQMLQPLVGTKKSLHKDLNKFEVSTLKHIQTNVKNVLEWLEVDLDKKPEVELELMQKLNALEIKETTDQLLISAHENYNLPTEQEMNQADEKANENKMDITPLFEEEQN